MYNSEILGSGSCSGENIIDNGFFSSLVEDCDAWICSRTGIKERRYADVSTSTSDLASKASLRALNNAGIHAEELECIILATSTPDMILPQSACFVQSKIGAINASCFDINAVCSGFVYGIHIANAFIQSQQYGKVLVVGADTYSKILDYEDKGTSPLFGDGAGAIILGATKGSEGIQASIIKNDGSGAALIDVPSSGSRLPVTGRTIELKENTFKMQGRKVYTFAIRVIPELILELALSAHISIDEIDYIIPHQANVRIIESVAEKLSIPKAKFLLNLQKYGNTAAGSVGLAFDEFYRSGVIRSGHVVMILGFGGGLSWGGTVVRI